jgi:hypothetical protein
MNTIEGFPVRAAPAILVCLVLATIASWMFGPVQSQEESTYGVMLGGVSDVALAPGKSAVVNVTITNTGSDTDTFSVVLEAGSQYASIKGSSQVSLTSGDSTLVEVFVFQPEGGVTAGYTVTVEAVSQGAGGAGAEVKDSVTFKVIAVSEPGGGGGDGGSEGEGEEGGGEASGQLSTEQMLMMALVLLVFAVVVVLAYIKLRVTELEYEKRRSLRQILEATIISPITGWRRDDSPSEPVTLDVEAKVVKGHDPSYDYLMVPEKTYPRDRVPGAGPGLGSGGAPGPRGPDRSLRGRGEDGGYLPPHHGGGDDEWDVVEWEDEEAVWMDESRRQGGGGKGKRRKKRTMDGRDRRKKTMDGGGRRRRKMKGDRRGRMGGNGGDGNRSGRRGKRSDSEGRMEKS